MSNIRVCTKINKPAYQVISRFGDGLFEKLVPSFSKVLRNDGIFIGSKVVVGFKIPFIETWHLEIINCELINNSYFSFTDIGLSGMPFGIVNWKHHHRVLRIDKMNCFIVDDITFNTRYKVLDFIVKQIFLVQMKIRTRGYRKFFN